MSLPEKELKRYLKGFHKTRKVIPPYEIDFYHEGLRLGIEFNGNYWHSEVHKPMYYHQEKSQMAYSNGIRLYQIFEYEWTQEKNQPIIFSQLNKLMGYGKQSDADKIVDKADKEICDGFINSNSVRYEPYDVGIILYDTEPIALLTIKATDIWNLRYYEKCDTFSDGFNKLFNFFLNAYKPSDRVVVLEDLSKPIYNYPLKIKGCTEPKYVWCNSVNSLTESKKQTILQETTMSEDAYLHSKGYHKVYGCGDIIYEYEFNQ